MVMVNPPKDGVVEPLPNRFSMAYKLSVTKYFLSGVILQVLPHVVQEFVGSTYIYNIPPWKKK